MKSQAHLSVSRKASTWVVDPPVVDSWTEVGNMREGERPFRFGVAREEPSAAAAAARLAYLCRPSGALAR